MPEYIEVNPEIVSKAIQASAWFKDVPNDVVEGLIAFAKIARYEAGEKVYGIKSELKHVYGVLTGQIKISFVGDGEQYFSIMDFYDQFWCGESSLLNSRSSVLDVTAVDISDVIIIPAIELQKAADQSPVIYRNLYYDKMRQMQLAYSMFTSVLTYPLTARLSLRLLALIEERGFNSDQGICLAPAPTISEWARLAMGSVQRVEKIVQEWIMFEYIIEDVKNDRCFIPDVNFFEVEAAS